MDSKERFSSRASDYARARAPYADEVITAVLDGFASPVVADLGAGTGISSLQLAQAGATVLAVEPNEKMRHEMVQHERITPVDGSAERTGLPDHSIDIITAFQAYHWFDPTVLFTEIDRITKSRARFCAVWNHRDRSDLFTGAYESIIDAFDFTGGAIDADRRSGKVVHDLSAFGWPNVRVIVATHRKTYDWDLMIAYMRSVSYIPRSGDVYDAMVADMRALFERSEVNGEVEFVHVTQAFIFDR